ncbi:hypothetical protein NW768_010351 [Fusarium equiseti]|uniref:Uncharacterized protein n=1 Tax=Fusarium equiseti TaxID=61235 RepID=A0ABQ8R0M3_FUSEQ|nr:hypothetical protein NW768_010351 [Fusarium equiseti]
MDEQGDVVMGGTSDFLPEPSPFLTIQAKTEFATNLNFLIKLTSEPIPDLGSKKEQVKFLLQKLQAITELLQLLQMSSDLLADGHAYHAQLTVRERLEEKRVMEIDQEDQESVQGIVITGLTEFM